MKVTFSGYTNRTAALSNFPVLVVISNNVGNCAFDFAQTPFVSPSGYDLRFKDAANNALNYEIESWDVNSACYVWVKVPTIPVDGSGFITAQWGDLSFDEINRAVAGLPKADGQLFFLPFLYGSNAGLEMTCGFYGLQALHTRAHLLQAVYEGVVFSHMTHLNRMRERFTDVHALRVTGGPAHSDVWMQMLADVSGLCIELPQVEETGCFGAALAARVGTGVYRTFQDAQHDLQHPVRTLQPDMAAHARYQHKYQQYQHLIQALQGYHARIKEHAL